MAKDKISQQVTAMEDTGLQPAAQVPNTAKPPQVEQAVQMRPFMVGGRTTRFGSAEGAARPSNIKQPRLSKNAMPTIKWG